VPHFEIKPGAEVTATADVTSIIPELELKFPNSN
jgi:hypothetical protein